MYILVIVCLATAKKNAAAMLYAFLAFQKKVNAYAHAAFSGHAKGEAALAAAEAATLAAARDGDGDGEPDALDDLSSVELHPLCDPLAAAVTRTQKKSKKIKMATPHLYHVKRGIYHSVPSSNAGQWGPLLFVNTL